jgi:Kdo2-lipid IVA lauroyltransferase/acyltransferase
MILFMLQILLKPLNWLPLNVIHFMGAWLGRTIFFLSPKSKQQVLSNIAQSQLYHSQSEINHIAWVNATESGKSLLESLAIWQKKETELLSWVVKYSNWDCIEEALNQGKGIIFLTPHLGCFEITSIYYGAKHPITVLFRAPKQKFLHTQIAKGRSRTGVTLAEANASGVRKLMMALKRGEAIGILPDQIPAEGEGEWANFFGKPAYTMTLASKLAEKTGATVIMAFGERLAHGKGYELHLTKVDSIASPTLLNQAIERQIKQKPEQYLWQYNRYKARRHAMKKTDAPKPI